MPLIPVPNAYRVAVRLTRGDEQIVNVLHFRQNLDTETEQDQVMGRVETMYRGLSTDPVGVRGILNYLDDDVLLDTVTIQDLDVVPYSDPRQISMGVNGTNVSEPLPLATTINVQLRTALGSRNGRGRIFLGGFTTAALDESASNSNPIINATVLGAVGNAVGDLLDTSSAAGTPLVVASLYDGVDPVTKEPIQRASGIINNVTSAVVKNKFGVQRRRANKQVATSSVVVTP